VAAMCAAASCDGAGRLFVELKSAGGKAQKLPCKDGGCAVRAAGAARPSAKATQHRPARLVSQSHTSTVGSPRSCCCCSPPPHTHTQAPRSTCHSCCLACSRAARLSARPHPRFARRWAASTAASTATAGRRVCPVRARLHVLVWCVRRTFRCWLC
jgi:hypothetical protein